MTVEFYGTSEALQLLPEFRALNRLISHQLKGEIMILAIDPGLKGAVALYNPDLDWLFTLPLPVQWRMVNKKKKTELDMKTLSAWVRDRKDRLTHIIVEQPTALPNGGVTSQFNFGKTCGHLEGMLHGLDLNLPIHLVHPSKWKEVLNLPGDKRRARERASQIFPNYAHHFVRADSEGQAEAALLAYYYWQSKHQSVLATPGKAPYQRPHLPKKRKKAA